MITPYDWQEGIGHRAQYVESRLAGGVPVVAVSLDVGVLCVTYRRQSRKVYEIYDRLMFAGLGQQSDVEAIRVSAIDYTHQEGYQRSEKDVTIQRVVAAISEPVKRSFADFSSPPVVARAMFMQVGSAPELDRHFVIDFDGDFTSRRGAAYLAGSEAQEAVLVEALDELETDGLEVEEAVRRLDAMIVASLDPQHELSRDQAIAGLTLEAGLLERSTDAQRVFTLLHGDWD